MEKSTEIVITGLPTLEAAGVEVTALSNEYVFLKDTIEAVEITNEDDLKTANDFRLKVNKFVKLFDEKRKEYVAPYNERVKKINSIFNTTGDLFAALLKTIDNKIIPYMLIVEKRKQEWARAKEAENAAAAAIETARLLALAQATASDEFLDLAVINDTMAAEAAARGIQPKKSVKGNEAVTNAVRRWYGRVIDDALVPIGLKSADDNKIKALIKAHSEEIEKGTLTVAGIEFYSEISLTSRGRT